MPDGYQMAERPVYVSETGNVLPPPKTGLPLQILRVRCESVAVEYDDDRPLPTAPLAPEWYSLRYVKFPVSGQVPDSLIQEWALHVACRLADEGELP